MHYANKIELNSFCSRIHNISNLWLEHNPSLFLYVDILITSQKDVLILSRLRKENEMNVSSVLPEHMQD